MIVAAREAAAATDDPGGTSAGRGDRGGVDELTDRGAVVEAPFVVTMVSCETSGEDEGARSIDSCPDDICDEERSLTRLQLLEPPSQGETFNPSMELLLERVARMLGVPDEPLTLDLSLCEEEVHPPPVPAEEPRSLELLLEAQ